MAIPARLHGLGFPSPPGPQQRYNDDADLDADYIVVEIAKYLLGPEWLPAYVRRANTGGIERVLV